MDIQKTQTRRPAAMAVVPAVFCSLLVLLILLVISYTGFEPSPIEPASDVAISAGFQSIIDESMDLAESAALSVPKKFWLDDDTLLAPQPDPEQFGSSDDPASLGWLLEDAAAILNGQDTLFSTEISLLPGSKATYYLDDSIFAVTWKQSIMNTVYTISEVKVGHPSQFRRYVADNIYDNHIFG